MKQWIQNAELKKGALHRELHINSSKPISISKLNQVHNAKIGSHIISGGHRVKVTGLLKKRVQFAINVRK